MEGISTIGLIFSILILVVFFYMASNINVLKKKVSNIESVLKRYAINDGVLTEDGKLIKIVKPKKEEKK